MKAPNDVDTFSGPILNSTDRFKKKTYRCTASELASLGFGWSKNIGENVECNPTQREIYSIYRLAWKLLMTSTECIAKNEILLLWLIFLYHTVFYWGIWYILMVLQLQIRNTYFL